MTHWEYLSGLYWYDLKKKKYFFNTGGETQEVLSFTKILDHFGAQGWELVAINNDLMHATHDAWETNTVVTQYWVIFKRPKS